MIHLHRHVLLLLALSLVVACNDTPPAASAGTPPSRVPEHYLAHGQHPDWSLELDGEAIAWRPKGGTEAVYSHADRRGTAEAFDVDATLDGRQLTLEVERRPCQGPPGAPSSPDTVVVRVDGRTFRGCGGVPSP